MKNKYNMQRYSGGPKPSTARGKRRHAAKSEAQQIHAKKVWEGGYTIKRDTK